MKNKPAFRIGQKVWFGKKTDGRYNVGKVVSIDVAYIGLYAITEKQFFDGLEATRFKVAYIDCVTKKACLEWLTKADLLGEKPVSVK